MDQLKTTEFVETWEAIIPEPRLGGTFIYCPYAIVTVVKKGRKRVEEIDHCKFKTRNIRKYRRHYRRRHGAFTPEVPKPAPVVRVAAPAGPKYPVGDSRRRTKKEQPVE